MKTLKWLVVFSILGSCAYAQNSGFFVSAGGGVASVKLDDFAVFNPIASVPGEPRGEALAAQDKKASLRAARLSLGYRFDENWDLRLGYADYGEGEVNLAYPKFPGIFWAIGAGPDSFHRHVLKYKTKAYTLMPTYAKKLGEKLKIRAGAGLNYATTDSHIEATYSAGTIVFPLPAPKAYSYAETSYRDLGYIVMLGFEYQIFRQLSVEVTGNYATAKVKIPNTPWANRTTSQVKADALGAELALLWYW